MMINGIEIPYMTTIKEASVKTGLSYEFIRKLIREEKIIYVKAGKKFLVNFEKLIAYLNQGERAAAE